MTRVKISHVSSYFDNTGRFDNKYIEDRVNQNKMLLPPGILERLFGIKNRFFANDDIGICNRKEGYRR